MTHKEDIEIHAKNSQPSVSWLMLAVSWLPLAGCC